MRRPGNGNSMALSPLSWRRGQDRHCARRAIAYERAASARCHRTRQPLQRRADALGSAAGSPATCTLLLRLFWRRRRSQGRDARGPMPSREAAAAPRWRGRPRAARRPTPSGPASRPRGAQCRRSGRPARAGSAAPRPARRPLPPRAAARRKFQRKAGARSYRISRRRNISSRIRITGEMSTPPKLGRNERIGRSSRLGDPVEEIADHRDAAVVSVDDAERQQPAQDRLRDQQPDIDVDNRIDQPENRAHSAGSVVRRGFGGARDRSRCPLRPQARDGVVTGRPRRSEARARRGRPKNCLDASPRALYARRQPPFPAKQRRWPPINTSMS